MSTLKFYEDGPVIVSEPDYNCYCKLFSKKTLNIEGFESLYQLWVNENNRDGVRRLAIRDLLRQQRSLPKGSQIIHYDTGYSFEKLFCNSFFETCPDRSEGLYMTLRNRPKLCQEIVSETIYNLDNHYYNDCYRFIKNELQRLLDMLLAVATPDDISKLWQHHPIHATGGPSWIKIALGLYANPINIPDSIRDDLWGKIARSPICEKQNIEAIHDFICCELDDKNPRKSFVMGRCLQLLEDNLPCSVTYFSTTYHFEKCLYAITNDLNLTRKVLQRHILYCPGLVKDMTKFEELQFLLYARGVITMHIKDQDPCFIHQCPYCGRVVSVYDKEQENGLKILDETISPALSEHI